MRENKFLEGKLKPTKKDWEALLEWAEQLRKLDILIKSIPDKVWEGLDKIRLIDGKQVGMNSMAMKTVNYIKKDTPHKRGGKETSKND